MKTLKISEVQTEMYLIEQEVKHHKQTLCLCFLVINNM